MRRTLAALAMALIASAGVTASTQAAPVVDTTLTETTINTRVGGGYSFTCLGISSSCGETFGQSFTVSGPHTRLDSFAFDMTKVMSGPLNVVLRLFEWDGTDRVGSELFTSATTTLTHSARSLVSWSVGTKLTAGTSYMAYLDTAGLGNNSAARSGFYSDGLAYDGGYFAWERKAGDANWRISGDAQFIAKFSAPPAVPLPAALPLLAGGLSVFGLMGARRKRKAA